MLLYKKDNISISLIEESDIEEVLKLFSENTFNVTPDTGMKPTSYQFEEVIRENMNKETKKKETVLVLKSDDAVIGYLSCFIDYSRLTLGHIAVNEAYQHRGYGRLLTITAMHLASLSNRDVDCICYHRNKYLKSLGFETEDDIFYIFRGRLDVKIGTPDIFMSIEEYKEMKKRENEREVEDYSKFLDSDIGKMLLNL